MKINEIIVEGPKWDRFKRGTQRFFGGKPSLSKENPNDELAAAWEGFNTYYQSLVDAGSAPKLNLGNPAGVVEYNQALYKYLMQGKTPSEISKFPRPTLSDTNSKSNAQAYIKKMQAIARVEKANTPNPADPAQDKSEWNAGPKTMKLTDGVKEVRELSPAREAVGTTPGEPGQWEQIVDSSGITLPHAIHITNLNLRKKLDALKEKIIERDFGGI